MNNFHKINLDNLAITHNIKIKNFSNFNNSYHFGVKKVCKKNFLLIHQTTTKQELLSLIITNLKNMKLNPQAKIE